MGDVVVVLGGAAAALDDGADVEVVGVLDGGAATKEGSAPIPFRVWTAPKVIATTAMTPTIPSKRTRNGRRYQCGCDGRS